MFIRIASVLFPCALLASDFTEQILFISFEDFPVFPSNTLYFDDGLSPVGSDQYRFLENNPGQPIVTNPDLDTTKAFIATYFDAFGDVGLTDGDFVGVTNDPGPAGSFTDGNQGYRFSDLDGVLRLRFGPLDVSAYDEVFVTFDIYQAQTDWETAPQRDDIFVRGVADDGEHEYVVAYPYANLFARDLDEFENEGQWASIEGGFQYNPRDPTFPIYLEFIIANDSPEEFVLIDNIEIRGIPRFPPDDGVVDVHIEKAVKVEFYAFDGVQYQIEASPSGADGSFSVVEDRIKGDGRVQRFYFDMDAEQMFYRVVEAGRIVR